ncbi:YggS family pyridoxal phosphate-dependent enzyme [Alicyclobacillus macrosporangiidus]|uniref:YggS family pyridoxal phosphate-dependent enzyme n=1 Tax=Alicyclobacillus macrosporangiidus TaxID=392015 RepID=UPI0026E95007|nr:YggS family pyridoxal phosphate-dependent enzyme [Alicyclobacillus macrosporangiidus]
METVRAFQERLDRVRRMVAEACARSGRSPEAVRLVGVTKTVGPSAVPALLEAGVREFGENRWQHARELLEAPRAREAVWHFIGHLQSNKAKYVVRHFDWIHSVDSPALAQEISRQAIRYGRTVQVLIQVNVSGEETKSGIAPEEVIPLLRETANLPGLALRGLMTMAPKTDDPERVRPVFARLRELLAEARQQLGDPGLTELSMGMSDDFPIAVEEGATLIRVGRLLMGT